MPQGPRQQPLPRYSTPPLAWRCWLGLLGASPRLAQDLWYRFRRTASYEELAQMYHFSAHQDPAGAAELLHLISPQRLLTLCAAVAPEGTVVRRKDVRRLEDAIVARARGPQQWQ